MIIQQVVFVGQHHYHFRSGEAAEILGIVETVPEAGDTPRLALHVRYADGIEDYAHFGEAVEMGCLVTKSQAVKEGRWKAL